MFFRTLATGAVLAWLTGCTQVSDYPMEVTTSRSPADPSAASLSSSARPFINGYTHRSPSEPRIWRQSPANTQEGGGS